MREKEIDKIIEEIKEDNRYAAESLFIDLKEKINNMLDFLSFMYLNKKSIELNIAFLMNLVEEGSFDLDFYSHDLAMIIIGEKNV